MSAFQDGVKNVLPIVEAELRSTFDDCEKRTATIGHPFLSRVYSVLRDFTVGTGGKRLRPLSCLMAYRMCGGTPEGEARARKVAVALEFLHNTSLVHDDIMDEDEARRGSPTVWKVFHDERAERPRDGDARSSLLWKDQPSGFAVSHAILAGNILFGEAMRLCDGEPEVAEILADAYRIVHYGQVLDMVPSAGAGERDYLLMSRYKTGWLFRAAVLAGAAVAGASKEQRKALEEYALDAALAFQLQDDVMDVDPSSRKGHARGSDVRQGKATLLALGAVASGQEGSQELASIIANGGTADEAAVERAIALIERTSLAAVRERAIGLAESAKKHLATAQWKDESALAFFGSMADFFVQRNV